MELKEEFLRSGRPAISTEVTFCPSYDVKICAVAGDVFGNCPVPGACVVCARKERQTAKIEMHKHILRDVMKALPRPPIY
jgi:hypothetical protein